MYLKKKYFTANLLVAAALSLTLLLHGCKGENNDDANTDSTSQITKQSIDSSVSTLPNVDSGQQHPAGVDTAVESAPAPLPAADPRQEAQQTLAPAPDFVQDSTRKYIYLTFDDGPQPGTMNVYHVLRELGVKGTFFMVGVHETYSKTWRHVVDTIRAGYPEILLANHSYTHANGRYTSFYRHFEACFADFMKAQKSLGVQRKYIRLPGNSAWVLDGSLKASGLVRPVSELLDSAGYSVFGWDLEWSFKRDPKGPGSVPVESADRMIQMIERAVDGGHTHRENALMLLTHDRMFHRDNYRDSLYKVIDVLKTRHPEYVFETVENYPGANRN